MGIALWYSPLPTSQFHCNFNNLVSSISTLVPSNKINIQYNEFEDNGEVKGSSSHKPFNRYGFNILPPHITLIKNIPNNVETLNKIVKIITTTLHSEKSSKLNEIRVQGVKFNNKNLFFQNCVLEVDKGSIYILLSLITIITDIVEGLPAVDPLEYDPHISLSYSDYKFNSELEKDMIRDRIKTYLKVDFCENRESVSLDWFVRMASANSNKKTGRFYFVDCSGDIDRWSVLRSIDV